MSTTEDLRREKPSAPLQRPPWIKVSVPEKDSLERIGSLMKRGGLHTICQEAHCPNIYECWQMGTATFLILGEVCTRKCGFCAVSKGLPTPVDVDEPIQLAEAAARLELKHVVITSVDRDDLPDGGAGQFALCLDALREKLPAATTEILVPDFRPDPQRGLDIVLEAKPTIFSHNVETVRRLYPAARPGSDYDHSISLLRDASRRIGADRVKSSLILGLGEREDEIRETIQDLHEAGIRRLNMGQYLAPSRRHIPVKRYWTPQEFQDLGQYALEMGFIRVESAPLVRSSYHASV